MDVVRHDDVAEEEELVVLAELFEGFFDDGAGVVVVEIWEPVVAAEVDGVVVALLLIALQTARHEGYGTSGTRLPVVVWGCLGGGWGWVRSAPPHPCAKCAHEWGTRIFSDEKDGGWVTRPT